MLGGVSEVMQLSSWRVNKRSPKVMRIEKTLMGIVVLLPIPNIFSVSFWKGSRLSPHTHFCILSEGSI